MASDDETPRPTLKAIPTGLSSRLGATGRMVWRLGVRGATLFGDRHAADARLGDALLSELDELKGMAMKVGQILSYMDVGLPAEVTDRLSRLCTGVTPLPLETIVGVVEGALGRPLDACFSSFGSEPIAAASIGQVHRAVTLEGEPVAVKVRYPGIAQSLEGDFAQLSRLGALAGTFAAVDGPALVRELHARVLEECDYALEARWQKRFGELFGHDAQIAVPRVFEALSADAVLTTTFSDRMAFDGFRASAPQDARDAAALALLRFAYQPLFHSHVLHADPHPGNQLYAADGRITVLDFGCMRELTPEFVANFRGFCRAILDEDRRAFRELAIELGLAPRPERLDFEELLAFQRWLYAPVASPRFELSDTWWHAGQAYTRPTAKNARHQGVPPEWIWLQRVQWGLWAVLKRLGARADLATPFRALLD